MATIHEHLAKIKQIVRREHQAITISFLILGVGFGCFGFGVMYGQESVRTVMMYEHDGRVTSLWNEFFEKESAVAQFVASKNGSKFYTIGCSAAKRIKEENKVFFRNAVEAQELGFEKGSC